MVRILHWISVCECASIRVIFGIEQRSNVTSNCMSSTSAPFDGRLSYLMQSIAETVAIAIPISRFKKAAVVGEQKCFCHQFVCVCVCVCLYQTKKRSSKKRADESRQNRKSYRDIFLCDKHTAGEKKSF